jgi:hypothetical protein
MNMKLEPRQLALLGILGTLLMYLVYDNFLSGPETEAVPIKSTARPVPPRPGSAGNALPPPSIAKRGRTAADFRPSLRPRSDEVRDPATIDPSLQLELLAKLRKVTYTGAGRNLFEFGASAPAAPSTPDPKIIPGRKPVSVQRAQAIYPQFQPPPPPPPKPKAPPITMKYYGFVSNSPNRTGTRRGFFLDGEEIIVAGEGDVIKNRYKVLRISQTAAEMQDTQFADDRQQLPIVEEPAGD